jgi:hypothetical protein
MRPKQLLGASRLALSRKKPKKKTKKHLLSLALCGTLKGLGFSLKPTHGLV